MGKKKREYVFETPALVVCLKPVEKLASGRTDSARNIAVFELVTFPILW